MKNKIKVISIAYHRNGITGNGFYPILFTLQDTDTKGHIMLGIVFDELGSVAILDTSMLADNNIAFASNSWRGDWFESDLREIIKEYEEERCGI